MSFIFILLTIIARPLVRNKESLKSQEHFIWLRSLLTIDILRSWIGAGLLCLYIPQLNISYSIFQEAGINTSGFTVSSVLTSVSIACLLTIALYYASCKLYGVNVGLISVNCREAETYLKFWVFVDIIIVSLTNIQMGRLFRDLVNNVSSFDTKGTLSAIIESEAAEVILTSVHATIELMVVALDTVSVMLSVSGWDLLALYFLYLALSLYNSRKERKLKEDKEFNTFMCKLDSACTSVDEADKQKPPEMNGATKDEVLNAPYKMDKKERFFLPKEDKMNSTDLKEKLKGGGK